MLRKLFIIFIIIIPYCNSQAQSDTIHYPWPVKPFFSSHSINGTFGEFRNTLSSDHFHNAVDIGEPDGNPVYPCINGTVYNFVTNGYNSYINVKSIVNGKKKHLTYYHVVPSPSLSIGQNVTTGETIIGTIYNGAAHVHLIEREMMDQSSSSLGVSLNPIRPEGGLKPYTDTQSPVIYPSTLEFRKDRSTIKLSPNALIGKVDIIIRVAERNGTSSVHTNNGTYILGYRILSDDTSTVIYEPQNNGMKYRFYRLPYNSDVHNAFVKGIATTSNPTYWLTNGKGEGVINSTRAISNNYLNTDILNPGNYLLEIFSEDTRGNYTSKLFPIAVIKLPPELKAVKVNSNNEILVSWEKFILSNLKGYRLYYSDSDTLANWKLAADENTLHKDSTQIIFNSPNNFIVPSGKTNFYFYLTAIDSNNSESQPSDIYSCSINSINQNRILIVDGFDKYGGEGSWNLPQHSFNTIYYNALLSNFSSSISSCSNDAVIDESIDLNNYDVVVWFTGDESLVDNTLTNDEQYKLALYLSGGGKLFITGDNIGYDLDTKHSYSEFSDTLFYHQYLKAKLMHDGNILLKEVNGQSGSLFENFHTTFGEIYPEDSPDDIEPVNGAVPILNYTYERDGTFRKGGIAYTGTFGDSANIGQLVYISFAFETIGDKSNRNDLMKRILQYFKLVTNVNEPIKNVQNNFSLGQNYPNPFNPATTINYSIPQITHPSRFAPSPLERGLRGMLVKLKVYDILGREVATLVNKKQKPGNYKVIFDGSKLSSGVYYYRLRAGNFIETKKMILLK